MNLSFVGLTDAGWSTEPDVGALQLGDHDPHVRGFSIPNGELALDGTVDPHFKGFANIVYKLDPAGETSVELEEMYFLTTSLPANLQLKGGQFFAEFGRQNAQHPHAWAFADQPLVLNRMFGPEGLRSQGMRVSWLAPTPWYAEAMVGVFNSAGGTAYSFRSDESQVIHGGEPIDRACLGGRPADRPASQRRSTTATQTFLVSLWSVRPQQPGPMPERVYGADQTQMKSRVSGISFVSFQPRRYASLRCGAAAAGRDPVVTLPEETLRDGGAYAQVRWGPHRCSAGFVENSPAATQPLRVGIAQRSPRVSPNLTGIQASPRKKCGCSTTSTIARDRRRPLVAANRVSLASRGTQVLGAQFIS
jgi:hypothetical protein